MQVIVLSFKAYPIEDVQQRFIFHYLCDKHPDTSLGKEKIFYLLIGRFLCFQEKTQTLSKLLEEDIVCF